MIVTVVLSSPYPDVDVQVVCTFRFEFSREGVVLPSYDIQPVSPSLLVSRRVRALSAASHSRSRKDRLKRSADARPANLGLGRQVSRNGTAQLNAFIWVLILLLVVIMCVEIAGLVLHGAPTPTSRSPAARSAAVWSPAHARCIDSMADVCMYSCAALNASIGVACMLCWFDGVWYTLSV